MFRRVLTGVQRYTTFPARRFSNGSQFFAERREPWSLEEYDSLKRMSAMGLDRKTIAEKLGRSYDGVKVFAQRKGTRTNDHQEGGDIPFNNLRRPWTSEDDAKLRQLRKERMSDGQIAKALQRSIAAVSSRLDRIGLRTKSPQKGSSKPKQKWTQDDKKRFLELKAEGLSQYQIGQVLGRSLRSVEAHSYYLARSSQDDYKRSDMTEEELDQARDWYLAGKKVLDIRAALPTKYSYEQIWGALRRRGLMRQKPWTHEEIEKVMSMRESGTSYKDIVALLPGRSLHACQNLYSRKMRTRQQTIDE